MGDSDSDPEDGENANSYALRNRKTSIRRKILKNLQQYDLEKGIENDDTALTNKVDNSEEPQEEASINPKTSSKAGVVKKEEESKRTKITSFQLPKVSSAMTSMSILEQSMPADAVLAKEGAAEVRKKFHCPKSLLMKTCF